jgi:hypothetical protein
MLVVHYSKVYLLRLLLANMPMFSKSSMHFPKASSFWSVTQVNKTSSYTQKLRLNEETKSLPYSYAM